MTWRDDHQIRRAELDGADPEARPALRRAIRACYEAGWHQIDIDQEMDAMDFPDDEDDK